MGEKIKAWKGERVRLGTEWKTLTLDLRRRDEGDVGRDGGEDSSIESKTTIAAQQQRSSSRAILVHKNMPKHS